MRNRLLVALLAAGAVAAATLALQRPIDRGPEGITYEQLMRDYPVARRFTLFTEQLSAAKKVELMDTHYERCLAALGSSLTAEQLAILRDARAALSSGAYSNPPEPGASQKMEAVERRAKAAFPPELGVQIFTLWSECQPQ